MAAITIFAYKDLLGVSMHRDESLLNITHSPNWIGHAAYSSEVNITKEAKELIKGSKRSKKRLSVIMLNVHDDDSGSSFAIMSFGRTNVVIPKEDIRIAKYCDLSVLDDFNLVEHVISEEFRELASINENGFW